MPRIVDASTTAATAASSSSSDGLIEKLFGADALTYLKNKHRGGVSGKKGTRYEDQFATFKVAESIASHVEHGKPLPFAEEQAFGFVDDLALAFTDATKYYQCKNSSSVSWTAGDHPICVDFKCQAELANALQKPSPQTHLVVSDTEKAQALLSAVPTEIEAHSSVEYFPYFGSVNRLVLEHAPLRKAMAALTRTEHPSDDDLASAFGALLLSWILVVGGCAVEDILQSARQRSPQLLRVFPLTDGTESLQQEFLDALAAVPNLHYSVKRGFFSCAAEGLSVTLDRDCASEEFLRFQRRVIQEKPRNFDDFWDLLP